MSSATLTEATTALDEAHAALNAASLDHLWTCDDHDLIEQTRTAQTMINQLTAIHLRLVAELETRGAVDPRPGWTTAHLLVDHQPQPLATARATVKLATDLTRYGAISTAFARGELSRDQAKTIITTLDELPTDLDTNLLEAAQDTLLSHVDRLDPAALRRVGNHLVEVIAPDAVEDKLADQLDADDAKTRRGRYLSWARTSTGGLDLRGRLTAADGEAFIALISAHAGTLMGADAAVGLTDGPTTSTQRRADALMIILGLHQQARLAPDHGGDRPRVTVLLRLSDLITGLRGATLCGTDQLIGPGEARRLACDADLIPAVLGTDSIILDAGRQHRLFTRELRHVLTLRDGGCVFPGCPRPPADCEAHHITPWWNGGPTSITNGALLCPHHHRIVEPDPHAPPGTRWQLRLDPDQLPELIPADTIDPTHRPRQHQRFHERRIRSATAAA